METKRKKIVVVIGLVVVFIAFFIQQIGQKGPFRIPIKTDGRVKTDIPFAGSAYIGLPKWHSSFEVMYSERVISKSNVFIFPRGKIFFEGASLPVRISHPFYTYTKPGPDFYKDLKGKSSGILTCCWTIELSAIEMTSYEAIAEKEYLPKIKAAYEAGDEEEAVRIQYELVKSIFSGIRHWAFILKDKKVNVEFYRDEIIRYYSSEFSKKYILDDDMKKHFMKFISKNIDRGMLL